MITAQGLESRAVEAYHSAPDGGNLCQLWGPTYEFLKGVVEQNHIWVNAQEQRVEFYREGNRRACSAGDLPGVVSLELFEAGRIREWAPANQSYVSFVLTRAGWRQGDFARGGRLVPMPQGDEAGECVERQFQAPAGEEPERSRLDCDGLRERRDQTAEALARLRRMSSVSERRVFFRVYVRGERYADVALELGLKLGTIKPSLHRKFKRVAKTMGIVRPKRGRRAS